MKNPVQRRIRNGRKRAALLIRCSAQEAATIRKEAAADRRTVTNYVMNIVLRWMQLETKLLFAPGLRHLTAFRYHPAPGPRTAILVRCLRSEATAIRQAARRREISMSGYVLHALRLSWAIKRKERSLLALQAVA